MTTREALDEFRGFRHVVRNIYSFNLKPERIAALAQQLGSVHQQFQADLAAFCQVLQSLD